MITFDPACLMRVDTYSEKKSKYICIVRFKMEGVRFESRPNNAHWIKPLTNVPTSAMSDTRNQKSE